jgi:hypothetical protein
VSGTQGRLSTLATAAQKAIGLDTYDVRFLVQLAAWRLHGGWVFAGSRFVGHGIRADDLAEKGFVASELQLSRYVASSGSSEYKKAYRISEKGKAALAVETGEDAKAFLLRFADAPSEEKGKEPS